MMTRRSSESTFITLILMTFGSGAHSSPEMSSISVLLKLMQNLITRAPLDDEYKIYVPSFYRMDLHTNKIKLLKCQPCARLYLHLIFFLIVRTLLFLGERRNWGAPVARLRWRAADTNRMPRDDAQGPVDGFFRTHRVHSKQNTANINEDLN